MDKPIKKLALLIVEDVESDALLIVRLLKKAGYELVYKQVETPAQMSAALKESTWDIVISDYSLPQFDGYAALTLLKETGLDIPFIVVSGAMGEETAVAMMKAGTQDYLMKDNLARLIPAVERELEQAEIRRERRKAQEQLLLQSSALNAAANAIVIAGREGTIEWVNPAFTTLTLYTSEEAIGKNLRDLDKSDKHDRSFYQNMWDTILTGEIWRGESINYRKDGSLYNEEQIITPLKNADGTLSHFIAIKQDVSERKQSERALAASEAELRALFASMQDVVLVIDRQGLYRKIAPTNHNLLVRPPAELLGKNLTDVFSAAQADFFIDTIRHVLDTKQTAKIEYELLIGDRTVWFETTISPMDMDSTLWVARDLTQRKQAEEALAASEAELRALVEQVPAIVYTESADIRETTYISPQLEKMTGYTPVEWVNDHKLWEKVIHPEDRTFVIEKDTIATQTREPFSAEYRLLTRDGRILWIHDEAVLIRNQDETPLFWQGVMYDITERKQIEEAMQTTNILLEQTLEQSPIPMVLVSMPDGIIHSANSACRRFLGMEDEPILVGLPLSNLKISWQDFDMQGNLATGENLPLPRSLRGLKTEAQERRIIRKDGTTVYGLMYGSPIFDAAGRLIAGYLVMMDITERKQAEEFLQKSEERYRGLFNSMIDGFALHEIICDEGGKPVDYRFLEINPAFERLTGLQSETLIGRTVLEVMPNTEPYWIEFYGNVALTGHSAFFEDYSRELGRYFEVSAYCPRPGQFAVIMVDATERKRVEDDIHQRMTELEMLYQSGLALSQLLDPKEIGQKILELLAEKLDWHHTRIRLYHPQDGSLELLDFNKPGLKDGLDRYEAVEHFQSLITHSGQGMSGWVVQHGQLVRSGDVNHDPRYVEAYPGIRSGLYVPMKLSERIIGVISIESEQPNAFSETDERLISTLATQAASAFENARLFEETRQRVMELETLNRISLVLRSVTKQNEMLSIVLDEALAILNTSHGSIELYNKATDTLDQIILRGWIANLTEPHPVKEGIAGKVFTSGEIYISREFASDPETRAVARSQIPSGWGGVCLPIRTTQQTLGVMVVSMPSEHELNRNEIRLLSILSEMTGAALQRMQLHEQTVRRLEQLNALRAVDQAISSSRDMHLTLHILLTHTILQLNVDAADVLLLHPGSTMLEFVAGRGFHTFRPENISLRESFAGRVILEHLPTMGLTYETARQNPKFGKIWQDEGFACYWCVPLIIKGEVKGVLEIYCRKVFTPDAEWFEFLEALAGQAAIAIDNTQLFENLQRANMDLSLAYDATIEGWSRALDLRDHETEGHTLRVTDLTLKLARAMQVGESQLTAIRRGALLHDIGKMGVPDSILLKEGNLTDEEWALMRKHPKFAHDMLLPVAYLHNALDIPYCHHEKWDGTGYPQGLKGNQIPLAARIFAIVDVWDALTNDRAYRKKWTKQRTREHIAEQSGKHFDPQIVEVFLKNIAED